MVVIDASVISKLFLPLEENRQEAKEILRKHLQEQEEIYVPDLVFYEVANTLATKTAVPLAKVLKDLNKLDKFNFNVEHSSIEAIGKAANIAKDNHVSVYDAIYAVLAQDKGCILITADAKFADQIKLPFVKKLG